MRHPKTALAVAAGLALALSAVACGDDSSTGGGLSGGGSGGVAAGGTGGSGGSGGTGGTGGQGPSCTVATLAEPACATCVSGAVLACPMVAYGCFASSGPLQTCVEDAGCFDDGVDAACILKSCGLELMAVNLCMSACPQYAACFR